jgi:chemotaxis protein methyltransferase CheR
MNESAWEAIEIDLLLQAINRRYGYDFQHYSRASIRRRVRNLLAKSNRQHVSDLIPLFLYDEGFAQTAIFNFSIPVTEMFRDPPFYQALRAQIIPYLSTYPFFKVWIAGCATGEEVYSLAILLQEAGLYARATIYATDFNEIALQQAREGIYPLKDMKVYTANYQRGGGQHSFSEYYHAEYGSAIMDQTLKANITFANHNLAADAVFSEVQLIFCRNVLIYFDRILQNSVLAVLTDSLSRGGFLCLGTRESLDYSEVHDQYKVIESAMKIYQKRVIA